MKLPKISQSLIKAYGEYHNQNECGLFFKARYIDKDPECETEPTDAMRAGIYFEYLCTGALPKSKVVPEPDVVYKGKPNEKLSAPYERVVQSVELYKRILEKYDIEIIESGLDLSDDELSGVIDIYAKWGDKKVFIDLKYSGLIDDKWSDSGWNIDFLHEKHKLMVQAVQYKILAERCLGIVDIPFYFFVFSSGDPNNIRIIEVVVDESKTAAHLVHVGLLKENLEFNMKHGFKAYPTIQRCGSCPIAHKCNAKTDVPLIDTVHY